MLNGLNAFITGGDKGIGKAIAMCFAKNGANVYFTYNSDEEAAKNTLNELHMCNININARYYKLDIENDNSIDEISLILNMECPNLNILVNNAGITNDVLFAMADFFDWYKVIDVNFRGTMNLTHKLLPILLKQDYARIVNMSSIAGLVGIKGQTNYCSSKAAIIGFTQSLSKELGKLGINVNAIAPGYIETQMTNTFNNDEKRKLMKSISIGRFGLVDEVADVALFLSSRLSSYITGQTIIIDGGII